jgi:acetyltransferase-like isoleucine patch superfamily enzyme
MSIQGTWTDGRLPPGVYVGAGSLITGPMAFKRFYSRLPDALTIGERCTLDGVQFATGPEGKIVIGRNCYMNNAVMLAELAVEIGNYVLVGWNVTIADSDFHPIDPALRIVDAIACSPLAGGRQRPPVEKAAVRIGNDVYIGPGAVILKGVQIGDRAFIEPGSVVTRDVPPGARVMGNPARMLEGNE